MNDLQVLFKSNTLIKAKYDFIVSQNRVYKKHFTKYKKIKLMLRKLHCKN